MAPPILVSLSAEVAGAVGAPGARPCGQVARAAEVAAPDTEALGVSNPRELFLVVGEGEFEGRSFAVGDLLACVGAATSGDLVVLVPRGHGRPRLGTVQGARLLGDAGEPCHAIRWRVAGRLVSVVRDPQLARSLRPPPRRPPLRLPATRPACATAQRPRPTGQLSLFGVAA